MVTITKVLYSGGACPYQIEATTDTGKYFYLRYRGGVLSYGVWESEFARNFKYDFRKEIGDKYDGWGDHETISRELEGLVKFPYGFKHNFDSVQNYPPEGVWQPRNEAETMEKLRELFGMDESAGPRNPIIPD